MTCFLEVVSCTLNREIGKYFKQREDYGQYSHKYLKFECTSNEITREYLKINGIPQAGALQARGYYNPRSYSLPHEADYLSLLWAAVLYAI